MRFRLLIPALLVLSGCSSEPEVRTIDIPTLHYEGQGTVENWLAESELVVINHGEIEGFMTAMTMPFQVREDSVKDAIVLGDSIHFSIAYEDGDAWITRIVSIPRED